MFMEFQQVEGNTCGAETFFSSLFQAIRSKSKLTGKQLARLTFLRILAQENAWIMNLKTPDLDLIEVSSPLWNTQNPFFRIFPAGKTHPCL